MEIKNHILHIGGQAVKYLATPMRGGSLKPSYLIIHFTGDNNPQATIGWFLRKTPKKGTEASAHLLIDRDGNVTQFAPFNVVTYHAGKSQWNGVSGLNSHSIGIELTNLGKTKDGWQEYTGIQLQVAQEISALLVRHYSLKDVLGHEQIAPGRKVDPGPMFPMERFKTASGVGSVCDTMEVSVDLNLREGAGTTYRIISVLPKGTIVDVLQKGASWSKVHVINSKLEGWVSNAYVKK